MAISLSSILYNGLFTIQYLYNIVFYRHFGNCTTLSPFLPCTLWSILTLGAHLSHSRAPRTSEQGFSHLALQHSLAKVEVLSCLTSTVSSASLTFPRVLVFAFPSQVSFASKWLTHRNRHNKCGELRSWLRGVLLREIIYINVCMYVCTVVCKKIAAVHEKAHFCLFLVEIPLHFRKVFDRRQNRYLERDKHWKYVTICIICIAINFCMTTPPLVQNNSSAHSNTLGKF